MTDTSYPTETIPATPSPTPASQPEKRGITIGVGSLAIVGVLALLLGFAGGIVSHAIFPAKTGATGAAGKQGPAGEAGPAGQTGPPANINLSQLGYCVDVSYFNDTTDSFTWVSGVSIYAPTVTNGTQSCPSGTFTPIEASQSRISTQ